MLRILLQTSLASIFVLSFAVACAKEDPAAQQTQTDSVETQGQSIMDQPVDFSTPEAVEKSLQLIAEKEGEKTRKTVESALQYVLYYDLSIGNNKEKLYKSLDGKTPNQIIAKMKR